MCNVTIKVQLCEQPEGILMLRLSGMEGAAIDFTICGHTIFTPPESNIFLSAETTLCVHLTFRHNILCVSLMFIYEQV